MIPIFMIFVSIPASGDGTQVLGSQWYWQYVVAAIIFAVASFTDWLDGYIARRDNLVTNFGKFADPLADKMLVATAFIALVGIDLAPKMVSFNHYHARISCHRTPPITSGKRDSHGCWECWEIENIHPDAIHYLLVTRGFPLRTLAIFNRANPTISCISLYHLFRCRLLR